MKQGAKHVYKNKRGGLSVTGRICKYKDCENRPESKGFCSKNYQRYRTHGDPSIIKKPEPNGGRPSAITKEIEKRLEASLMNGASVTEACVYAKIAQRTYYNNIEINGDFKHKMEFAKQLATLRAKENVVEAIVEKKDLQTSKWWLEKKTDEFNKDRANVEVNTNLFQKLGEEDDEFIEEAEVV
jgi:hypothetical protein